MSNNHLCVCNSNIQGSGVFSRVTIQKGTIIDYDFFDIFGPKAYEFSYYNHCHNIRKNSTIIIHDGIYSLIATKQINPGDEITSDYNEASRRFPLLIKPANPEWTC